MREVNAESLTSEVEFDHPFEVTIIKGKSFIGEPDSRLFAPTVLDDECDNQAWEFVDGYSGQDMYSGPIMHPSEYLGGEMARDVLATPGIYVMVPAYYTREDDDPLRDAEPMVIEGWVLLRRAGELCRHPDHTDVAPAHSIRPCDERRWRRSIDRRGKQEQSLKHEDSLFAPYQVSLWPVSRYCSPRS